MGLKIIIDDAAFRNLRMGLTADLKDARPVLRKFHVHMLMRTGQTFRALRRGGTYRGVTWDQWADQYTRKTDGVTVPAWGGVAKVRGKGTVQGRKRPSRKRVTPSSSLLRDTGRLAAAAGLTARFDRGGQSLHMITTNVEYGPQQQERRPFLFFAPDDAEAAEQILLEHLRGDGHRI